MEQAHKHNPALPPDPAFLESRKAITRFLFLRDRPAKVDFAFVLGCPSIANIEPAIDLYKRRLTKKIIISGYGPLAEQEPEAEIYKAYAVKKGVPETAFILESKAKNTLENFTFSAPLIESAFGWNTVKRVAICAKPFHMRRALMTARQQWPAHVKYVMQPSNYPDDPPAETWHETEAGRRFVMSELRAIGAYALEGHVGGY